MGELVRSAVLTHYAPLAQSLGLDPVSLLREAGLPVAALTEPDLKVPALAVRSLLETTAALSGVDNVGLRLAETRRLSTMGLVGVVARDAPTLREALHIMIRYMRAHNESLFLEVREDAGFATIRDELVMPGGVVVPMRQAVELSLGALVRIIRVLLGDGWRPAQACFMHPPPRDHAVHRRLFGCWLVFNHDFNGLVFDAADLDQPIPSADPVMARFARQQLDAVVSAGRSTTLREVEQLVMILLPTGRCSIEQVARHLGVDRRTIHRQLARDGHTFSAVVEGLRAGLCDRYLHHSGRSLTEVAALLGFSGPSAFAKWHLRRWGQTAGDRRRSLQAGPEPSGQEDGRTGGLP